MNSSDPLEDLDKSTAKSEDCPTKSVDFTVEILTKSEDSTMNLEDFMDLMKYEDLPWINLRI